MIGDSIWDSCGTPVRQIPVQIPEVIHLNTFDHQPLTKQQNVTHSGKSNLIQGENKAAFRREGHNESFPICLWLKKC